VPRHHDVSILISGVGAVGRFRGVLPRRKVSMTIMRPPQQGHGWEMSRCSFSCEVTPVLIFRIRLQPAMRRLAKRGDAPTFLVSVREPLTARRVGFAVLRDLGVTLIEANSSSSFLDEVLSMIMPFFQSPRLARRPPSLVSVAKRSD
jgi:hypothetical protein